MNDRPFALKVQHLTVNYGKTPALWDLSFEVPTGLFVGIVGPNGAGKSTLIQAVLGLVPSISGKVELLGGPIGQYRSHIAYVPQRKSIDWDFPITVRELVLMGRYGKIGLLRWPKKADVAAADRYLTMVGMENYSKRQISQLSGGQQQRVFIARALMQEAEIYFLDEPFAGIDLASETVIIELLRELRDQGKTLFAVHHDLNSVESYFDWLLLLNLRLVASGPSKAVFTPDNLNATYGKNYSLLDEALKLSEKRTHGAP